MAGFRGCITKSALTKTCAVCEGAFEIPPGGDTRRQVCSDDCKKKRARAATRAHDMTPSRRTWNDRTPDAGATTDAPIPKTRRQRPGWTLKPASRAAFERGCTCYTVPGLIADGRDEHRAGCPLRKPEDLRDAL